MKLPYKNWFRANLIPLALLMIILAAARFNGESRQLKSSEDLIITKYAQETLQKCSGTVNHSSCYDEEIPKLIDFISMEEALKVADLVQKKDPAYGYCHVLGHNLSAKEVDKNPDKWVDVIHRCPQGICSNGCLHGAAQERFRNDVLTDSQIKESKKELSEVCEPTPNWKPSGLQKSECYHGLGHLAMYITGANIRKSIDVCESLTKTENKINFRNLCFEGLFMQLFQPLEKEDFTLVKGLAPSKENLRPFCEKFGKNSVTEACWQEGWPLYRSEVSVPKGTSEYCSQSQDSYSKNHCLFILFFVKAQQSNYNQRQLADFCSQMPNGIVGKCFGTMANAIIHGGIKNIGQSVKFCSLAKAQVAGECYQMLADYASYNISPKTEEFKELCNALPAKFNKDCLQNQNWN